MKKEYQIFIAIGVGLSLYLYVFVKMLIMPINNKIAELTRVEAEKRGKLEEAKLLAESLPQLQQETKILELEIAEIEKKLPKESSLPQLIKIISKQAQNYGVRLNMIQPRTIDDSAPKFREIPFSISFQGSFHTLGQFFTELAQERRIISSRDLTVSYSATKDYPLTGTCILYAFSLKE